MLASLCEMVACKDMPRSCQETMLVYAREVLYCPILFHHILIFPKHCDLTTPTNRISMLHEIPNYYGSFTRGKTKSMRGYENCKVTLHA